ncbi:MAG TPA: hypothetical protein DCX77_09370 [Acidimicrobiaceae bacterium]|nr:hypothetical protein [Acidimicrobiaceae bacterium]
MKSFFTVGVFILLLAACSSTSDTAIAKVDDTATTIVEDAVPEEESTPTALDKSPELIQLEEAWDVAASRPGADIGQVFQLFRLKQSLGPKNLACYDPESGDVCQEIVEAINVVGLTEQQLTLLLDSLELPHRVIERDCELLMVTEEFVGGRVNFSVFEGVVTGWASEGGGSFLDEGTC